MARKRVAPVLFNVADGRETVEGWQPLYEYRAMEGVVRAAQKLCSGDEIGINHKLMGLERALDNLEQVVAKPVKEAFKKKEIAKRECKEGLARARKEWQNAKKALEEVAKKPHKFKG